MTLQVERLATAVRYIDANPLRWNQQGWGTAFLTADQAEQFGIFVDYDPLSDVLGQARAFPFGDDLEENPAVAEACGTAFCVAGWVTHQAQYVDGLDVVEVWDGPHTTLSAVRVSGKEYYPGDAAQVLLTGSAPDMVETAAQSILRRMFSSNSTRFDIQRCAEMFARLAGEKWSVPLPEWAPSDTYWEWELDDDGNWVPSYF